MGWGGLSGCSTWRTCGGSKGTGDGCWASVPSRAPPLIHCLISRPHLQTAPASSTPPHGNLAGMQSQPTFVCLLICAHAGECTDSDDDIELGKQELEQRKIYNLSSKPRATVPRHTLARLRPPPPASCAATHDARAPRPIHLSYLRFVVGAVHTAAYTTAHRARLQLRRDSSTCLAVSLG